MLSWVFRLQAVTVREKDRVKSKRTRKEEREWGRKSQMPLLPTQAKGLSFGFLSELCDMWKQQEGRNTKLKFFEF